MINLSPFPSLSNLVEGSYPEHPTFDRPLHLDTAQALMS